ncbi:hypothetical protein ACFL5Z_16205 [Planctomycetota bacterium]
MEPDTIEQDIYRADPQKLSQIRGQPQVTELLEMHLQGHVAMRRCAETLLRPLDPPC